MNKLLDFESAMAAAGYLWKNYLPGYNPDI
jgi:hypothetical protein